MAVSTKKGAKPATKQVTVATNGDVRKVPFHGNMTAMDAVRAAEFKVSKRATLTVNGQKADGKTKLQSGDKVVITPRISNG